MPREAVIMTMGVPHSISAQGEAEYLTYNLIVKRMGERRAYGVRLVNGRVEAFGEAADFGTGKFTATASNSVPANPISVKR